MRCWFETGISAILTGPYWKCQAVLAILAAALLRACPNYGALTTPFVEQTWAQAQVKIESPLADTARLYQSGTHESNVTFRIVVPAIAKLFRLRRVGMLVLAALAGILLLFLTLHVAEGYTSRETAFFTGLSAACVWPGLSGFHELRGGYFDAVALCLAVAAFAARSSLVATALVFLAAWTDERALVATSFLICLERWRVYAAGGSAYLVSRVAVTMMGSYAWAPSGVGVAVLMAQIRMVPLAAWSGLGALWIPVLRTARVCDAALLMAAVFASTLAVDTTRSVSYVFPAVFLALSRMRGIRLENAARVCACIAFFVPTVYVEGQGYWLLKPLWVP